LGAVTVKREDIKTPFVDSIAREREIREMNHLYRVWEIPADDARELEKDRHELATALRRWLPTKPQLPALMTDADRKQWERDMELLGRVG
jgi:hypothetical protein